MKIVIILLALACAGLLWMRHDNSNLRASFERANRGRRYAENHHHHAEKSAQRCR
ncbi:putative prophage P2 LysB-like protein [Klebsiella pneumoniae]|uniref:Putative prophage P2 LysB-like protein n=1 Tax=Klebsiella pneumoniae TaxID=573 RepID=A0A2X3EVH2_KLEPN|nr:putative prophage P2 LysB-like protein [Klebsiella pneumoniae]